MCEICSCTRSITIIDWRRPGATIRLVVVGFVRAKWIMRMASVVVLPDWRGKTTTRRLLGSVRSSAWYGVGLKLNHSVANLAGSEGISPPVAGGWGRRLGVCPC